MTYDTEAILNSLITGISALDEVQSIGISGSITPLPKAGEGDIDIFIYCDKIPELNARQALLNQMGSLLGDVKVNVFSGGHWGTGDFVLINGVETWLMYFTVSEAVNNVESILNGDYPDKLNNYYPIGRCAMLKSINVFYDKSDFLHSLKIKLSEYPDKLAQILVQYHMNKLNDKEDLERAVLRKDTLFYHFAIDNALDHFLQVLFAVNRTYFPSRKRTLEYIRDFSIKPESCSGRLLEVIQSGATPEGIGQSYTLWCGLVNDLKTVCGIQTYNTAGY